MANDAFKVPEWVEDPELYLQILRELQADSAPDTQPAAPYTEQEQHFHASLMEALRTPSPAAVQALSDYAASSDEQSSDSELEGMDDGESFQEDAGSMASSSANSITETQRQRAERSRKKAEFRRRRVYRHGHPSAGKVAPEGAPREETTTYGAFHSLKTKKKRVYKHGHPKAGEVAPEDAPTEETTTYGSFSSLKTKKSASISMDTLKLESLLLKMLRERRRQRMALFVL